MLTAGAVLLSLASAEAANGYCAQLQSQYISASRSAGRGDVGQIRQDLARVQDQARRLGCQRFLFFGPRSPRCPAVMANLNSLQRNLDRAGGGGFGFGSGFVRQQASQQRDYLRQALLDNGCGLPSSGWAGGGYRTLCVRTCDGFYFPISYSVGQGRFKTDQIVCKAMYGGAEADLYVHNNGSTAEQAVSLAGRPYTAEPFAFQFRQGYNASCAAELHAGLKSLGAVFAANVASQKAADEAAARATPVALRAVPVPIARIAWSQDPETLANLAGDFRMEDQAPPDAGTPEATVADGSTAIRKLGSEYYYVQPVRIEGLGKRKPKPVDFDFIGTAHADEAPASREAPEPDPTVIR